jgi:hypothetical protein
VLGGSFFLRVKHKASLNGEFHRSGFPDVKLWYEIDVSLNAWFHCTVS